jgi:hypothetical protein
MKNSRLARRSDTLEVIVSTLVMVTALAAWLASGGGAAGAAVPGDMSSATGGAPVLTDSSAEDRTARLLAGFPDVVDERASRARPNYGPRIDRAFARFEEKVGGPMQTWAAAALAHSPGETVFYPFAGADFPTAHRLYPNASRYVLIAMQRGGPPPDPDALAREDLGEFLAGYERLLGAFLRRGFFVTAEMNQETRNDAAIRGITGALMVFAAREGFEVLDVEPVDLADDGTIVAHAGDRGRAATWDSVRLTLKRRADGQPVTLEYLRVGLSNNTLKADTPEMTLVAGLSDQWVILKAASHLPQDGNFTAITKLLLTRAPTIVQDETGVAYDALKGRFAVKLYGSFKQVNLLFDGSDQETLIEAYRTAGPLERLPFHVGYRKGAAACMLVATRATVTSDAR